jgi:hypothetical protein
LDKLVKLTDEINNPITQEAEPEPKPLSPKVKAEELMIQKGESKRAFARRKMMNKLL